MSSEKKRLATKSVTMSVIFQQFDEQYVLIALEVHCINRYIRPHDTFCGVIPMIPRDKLLIYCHDLANL